MPARCQHVACKGASLPLQSWEEEFGGGPVPALRSRKDSTGLQVTAVTLCSGPLGSEQIRHHCSLKVNT